MMTNYFYFDNDGRKYGPVNDQQLRDLAARGIITPHTPTETDTGYSGAAGVIPGLFGAAPPSRSPLKLVLTGCLIALVVFIGLGVVAYGVIVPMLEENSSYRSSFEDIFKAAQEGTVADVAYFLRQGVDVNAKDDAPGSEATPLHWAASGNPNVGVLKYLVKKGADVNAKNKFGWTPLFSAAYRNPNVDVVKYLVGKGENVNARTGSAFVDVIAPLHLAAAGNPNVDVLKYLVKKGADVNAKATGGVTPLHAAAFGDPLNGGPNSGNANVENLKYLIEKGADVNAKASEGDCRGITPLHLAAGYSSADAVKYLLEKEAYVNARTSEGKTPLDVIVDEDKNAEAKRSLLRKAGGKYGEELD